MCRKVLSTPSDCGNIGFIHTFGLLPSITSFRRVQKCSYEIIITFMCNYNLLFCFLLESMSFKRGKNNDNIALYGWWGRQRYPRDSLQITFCFIEFMIHLHGMMFQHSKLNICISHDTETLQNKLKRQNTHLSLSIIAESKKNHWKTNLELLFWVQTNRQIDK